MILTIEFLPFVIFASLTAISWSALLTKKGEAFGWIPIIVMKFYNKYLKKEDGTYRYQWVQKLLWGCAKCISAWVFLIFSSIYHGFALIQLPLAMVTVLLTDQLTKLFRYA